MVQFQNNIYLEILSLPICEIIRKLAGLTLVNLQVKIGIKVKQKISNESTGSATPERFGAFTTCPAGNLCIAEPSLRMLEKFKQHSDVPYVKYNGVELFLR